MGYKKLLREVNLFHKGKSEWEFSQLSSMVNESYRKGSITKAWYDLINDTLFKRASYNNT